MKKCPLCNGAGMININPLYLTIKELKEKGLTIRQIASIVGKSSTTVHYHLHRNKENVIIKSSK